MFSPAFYYDKFNPFNSHFLYYFHQQRSYFKTLDKYRLIGLNIEP